VTRPGRRRAKLTATNLGSSLKRQKERRTDRSFRSFDAGQVEACGAALRLY